MDDDELQLQLPVLALDLLSPNVLVLEEADSGPFTLHQTHRLPQRDLSGREMGSAEFDPRA